MIAAYHERIEHFEKKLNVKEKVGKIMYEKKNNFVKQYERESQF